MRLTNSLFKLWRLALIFTKFVHAADIQNVSSVTDLLGNLSDCDLQMMYSDSEDLDSQMSFSVLNMVLTIVFVPPKDRRLIGVRNRYSLDIIKSRVSFCRLSFIFSGRAKENLGNEIYGDDINDDGIENDGNEDDDTEDDDVEDDDIGDDNIEDVDIEGDDVDDDDIKDDDVKDDDVEDDDVEDDDIEDQDDIWERFFKGDVDYLVDFASSHHLYYTTYSIQNMPSFQLVLVISVKT